MDGILVSCDGCGIEISWSPVVRRPVHSVRLEHYCCQDCLEGNGCTCAERMELNEERHAMSGVPGAWPP
jgi:hypothetical protein